MRPKLLIEFLGTAFLTMVVLGSGVMAQSLFQGHVGFALLTNSLATGAGLFVLIQCLNAHMNPVVSLVEWLGGRISRNEFMTYGLVQMLGAYVGILAVHVMFAMPVLQVSHVVRAGPHLLFSEVLATFGLICVVRLSGKNVALCVAAYIMSAYWFTSSTSFANPAVSFARMFTDSFGGMAPAHFLPFVLAQLLGGTLGFWVCRSGPR
jgi:glycerol uptake facilitator-like aquaporin